MATVIKKGTSKSEIRKSIRKAANKRQTSKLSHLAGTLKSRIDPLEFQKKIRDEWK